MADLAQLTPGFWKAWKKRADIESKAWFGSHASVGSAIGKLNRARASWKRSATEMNVIGYSRALTNLRKQMSKFLAAKEFKTEIAQNFYNEIVKWKKQIDVEEKKLLIKLAQMPATEMATANNTELQEAFDQFIL